VSDPTTPTGDGKPAVNNDHPLSGCLALLALGTAVIVAACLSTDLVWFR
jgi:hypothetical protein